MTISAKVIAYSRFKRKRIITIEFEYPRFIHGELMTHRVFSRNAASSRAIPVSAMLEQVRNNPAMPIHWGANQSGMQAENELSGPLAASARFLWRQGARLAAGVAQAMDKLGLHKQVANRILEPFQIMKTVVTSTEWENFFWLRNHPDAQPEIKELARLALIAINQAIAIELKAGDWHVPYYGKGVWRRAAILTSFKPATSNMLAKGNDTEYDADGVSLADALAISSSCCAQVSYRKLDDTLEKAKRVFARLVESEPVHASPFEHQATPVIEDFFCHDCQEPPYWQAGVTHVDKDGQWWSGNLCGFVQHRQLIPNNVKRG